TSLLKFADYRDGNEADFHRVSASDEDNGNRSRLHHAARRRSGVSARGARSMQSECGGSCSCETARVITLLAILSASRANVLHGVASSSARQPRMIRG